MQAGLLAVLSAACFAAAATFGGSEIWPKSGALILFLVLLTVLNAPFDWAALGLTRALLRRGLEREGWWPYVYALLDAFAAAAVIALLTVVCVVGVQAFGDLAARAGGENARIVSLDDLFRGIGTNPAAPEFWWVYAMLLSTMIPSLVNLTIGGASLLRGVPWITSLILRNMPERGTPNAIERTWMTLLLTAQMFVGGLLGIAAQGVLVYIVIGLLLPIFGFDLLDLARAVAAPDLPGALIAWVTRGPPR